MESPKSMTPLVLARCQLELIKENLDWMEIKDSFLKRYQLNQDDLEEIEQCERDSTRIFLGMVEKSPQKLVALKRVLLKEKPWIYDTLSPGIDLLKRKLEFTPGSCPPKSLNREQFDLSLEWESPSSLPSLQSVRKVLFEPYVFSTPEKCSYNSLLNVKKCLFSPRSSPPTTPEESWSGEEDSLLYDLCDHLNV